MSISKAITVWRAMRSKTNFVSVHTHEHYEIVYYLEGGGEILINGIRYPFSEGFYAVIPPDVEHAEQWNLGGKVICSILDSDLPLHGGLFRDEEGGVLAGMLEMHREFYFQPQEYHLMLAARTDELIIQIRRQTVSLPRVPKQLGVAQQIIEQNFNEPIVLSGIAKQFGYSYDYFHHRFKKEFGKSPKKYILDIRIKKASELLRSTEMSCTQIAHSCGFCSSAQFSKQFREYMGMSPMQFRKKQP